MKHTEVMLHFIAGPSAGKSISVKESTTIGRALESNIPVADRRMSRTHVKIFSKDELWWIEDLKSSNGTWLGTERITGTHELKNLQHIRIGSSVLEVDFPDDDPRSNLRILHSIDPLHLRNLSMAEDEMMYPSEHRRLAAIYGLTDLIKGVQDENELFSLVTRYLIQSMPQAEKCCIYLLKDNGEYLTPAEGIDSEYQHLEYSEYPVSRKILNYVSMKLRAILCVYNMQEIKDATQSVVMGRNQQFLVAPLIHERELLGVVCLSSSFVVNELSFTEGDLQFLTGVVFTTASHLFSVRLNQRTVESERLAALGTTAASLSHYIKNILTGVDGCLYLMRMGIDEEDSNLMNDAWNVLSRNHKRLTGLMLDLLNLAKESSLNIQPHSLTEIIVEVVDLLQQGFENRGIKLKVSDQIRFKSLVVDLDSMAIHRVFLNLLNNAADAIVGKYKGEEGGMIELRVDLSQSEQLLEIDVIDNGEGIPEEMKSRVFEVFYTGKGDEGTGLGLAVSKKIIESHKGNISFSSDPNGTIFSIRLPLHQRNNNTRLIDLPEDFLSQLNEGKDRGDTKTFD
ncbi:ATP-binding protein [Lentisphaera profundi]|uniref:histidine kinase n=1 Tax=Lentisphaera profundi TaxID=1658616 RepID=A0ABY7VX09_9BACT|nr:ATP-binding protein [Lentisphaera profundi]WDE97808.1 ATP-binding protein [Lentisphaera profundi]